MKEKSILEAEPLLRIAIVEDYILIRKSMMMLVDSFKGMKVVLDAGNGDSFLKQIVTCPVDIVLLDIQMPVMDGYETCRRLLKKYPEIKVLIVSQLITSQSIHKIMEIGAHGYFTKNSVPEKLEMAIRNLHKNGYYFGSEVDTVLRESILIEKKNFRDSIISEKKLTERELQVVSMICKAMTSQEIANQLFISVRSVEAHRRSIMEKTYSQNVIGVVLYVLKRGLISLDEL